MNATARTTKDVDGLIRGDIEAFLIALNGALAEPGGPLTLHRGRSRSKVVMPRRFDLFLELRGVTWRRIQFEISPDGAGIGDTFEAVEPAPLDRFGLPEVDALVGIAIRFQIAQKLHAPSDPHDPPTSVNDRPRDITALLLLRDLVRGAGAPMMFEIREASVAVFKARAAEAIQLGRAPRYWPPVLVGYRHWGDDYRRSAASANVDLALDDAIGQANEWIAEIAAAVTPPRM